jgi:elongation factor P
MTLISTNDFRTGLTVEIDGDPYQVVEFMHVKPGKGSPFVRAKIKNLRTGSISERTFNAGEKLPKAMLERKEMQYLYNDGENYYFMDNETYDQVGLSSAQMEGAVKYLKENMNISASYHKGRLLNVDLPHTVELVVTETAPGIKGDTASGGSKPATLETGLVIQVPFFIEEGEVIQVDTRTGTYLKRA